MPGLPPGEQVVRLHRLRLADGVRLALLDQVCQIVPFYAVVEALAGKLVGHLGAPDLLRKVTETV